MQWLQDNWPVLVSVGWALSEALALIPKLKANSVFQLIAGLLKKAKETLPTTAPKAE
jgi:hypothetical protein